MTMGRKRRRAWMILKRWKKADQLLAIAEKHYSKIGVRTARQTIAARIRKLTTQG